MQFCLPFQVGYYSIGADYQLRLSSLLKLFQEAAILHAAERGLGEEAMGTQGLCWVLYKLDLDVLRYPCHQERAEVVTCLGGWKGFKTYRYFEVLSGGERLASGLSIWFLLDVKSRKPVHVTEILSSKLMSGGKELPKPSLREWKPPRTFDSEWELPVTTRLADVDTNGHVNNAVYADYLETALARWKGSGSKLKTYRIQFNHEITLRVPEVRVELRTSGGGHPFQIRSDDMVFAQGEALLF